MRTIDAHTHLWDEPDYVAGLLKAMDACGVERACVSGLGPLFAQVDNAAVERAFRQHPDRLIGGLNKAVVKSNRKMLAEMAMHDPEAFTTVAEIAKQEMPA